MNKNIIACIVASTLLLSEASYAAFGGHRSSSSGFGVSRSATISKPKTYSTTTSKPQTYSSSSRTQSRNRVEDNNYKLHYYPRSGHTQNYPQYQQGGNSALRDIGVTAAGVAGGVLAAEAIKGLIAGPHGTYSHPGYPGQYFNAQGVPVAPPTQDQMMGNPGENAGVNDVYGHPPIIVQQVQEKGIMSSLWGFLGSVLNLMFFLGVVSALLFGGWWLFKTLKRKWKQTNEIGDLWLDIDHKAAELFYNFQKNANNKEWIEQNSKNLPIDEILSPACNVLRYEQEVVDVSEESGKIRATVRYDAIVKEAGNMMAKDEHVMQYWNYEYSNGKWLLVGVDPVN